MQQDSRRLVLNAMNHKEVDRIPVYFGGTSSFLTDEAYVMLKNYLGIKGDVDPYRKGHTGTIYDERILDALGVDVRFLVYKLENYGIRENVNENRIIDDWGVPIIKSGGYWSRVEPPLEGADLEAIKNWKFPDASVSTRNDNLLTDAKRLAEDGRYAVAARSPYSAGFIEYGCWMLGTNDFMCGLMEESDEINLFLDRVCEAQCSYYEEFLKIVGPYVDIVETSEDYGTQTSMFLSPDTYRALIMPRKLRIHEVIHKYAPQAKILHHSCGAIRKLMPALIETGIDIINPIQPGLPGMDPAELKAEFGRDIAFCGGIDMQHAINGSFDEIKAEVERCVDAFGFDGGYFLCTSNHVQSDTPPENVVYLFECFKEIGKK